MRQPGHAGPPLPTRHLQILILLKHVQIAGGGTVGLLGPSIFLSPVPSGHPRASHSHNAAPFDKPSLPSAGKSHGRRVVLIRKSHHVPGELGRVDYRLL